MSSVGITYTVSVVASKISFLLLLRRIFGMRVVWFKWAWYITFAVLFPIWTTVAFTFAGLSFAKAMSLAVTLKYAIPSVTFINTFSDLLILVLPIGMTRSLQLSWQQRLSVMFMFMLGSAYVIHLLDSSLFKSNSLLGALLFLSFDQFEICNHKARNGTRDIKYIARSC